MFSQSLPQKKSFLSQELEEYNRKQNLTAATSNQPASAANPIITGRPRSQSLAHILRTIGSPLLTLAEEASKASADSFDGLIGHYQGNNSLTKCNKLATAANLITDQAMQQREALNAEFRQKQPNGILHHPNAVKAKVDKVDPVADQQTNSSPQNTPLKL